MNVFAMLPGIVLATATLMSDSALAQPSGCPTGNVECAQNAGVAAQVNDELDHAKIVELWNQHVSDYAKSLGTEDLFIASVTPVSNALSAGVAHRKMVAQGLATDASGKPFYGRLYKVVLNTNQVFFESLALIKEKDDWKVLTFVLYPAPPGTPTD